MQERSNWIGFVLITVLHHIEYFNLYNNRVIIYKLDDQYTNKKDEGRKTNAAKIK